MDEKRLERALRQGPPFTTGYVSPSLALDESDLTRRGGGAGRLVLLVAVTALLLAGMLGGLATIGNIVDDNRRQLRDDAVIPGLDGQAFMDAWEATGSRADCSGPQPATAPLLYWTCGFTGEGNVYNEGAILVGERPSAIRSVQASVELAGGGFVDPTRAAGLFAYVVQQADFDGADTEAAAEWARQNGGTHIGHLAVSGVTYELSGPPERRVLKIALTAPAPVTSPFPTPDVARSCAGAFSPSSELDEVPVGALHAGTYTCYRVAGTDANVQFTVPAGWEWTGSFLSKGGVGSADEARISIFEGNLQVYSDPCQWAESNPRTGGSVTDLIDALAAQPMRGAGTPTERHAYSGGSDRTLPPSAPDNGWEGTAIELVVPADIDLAGCDEGQFRSWGPEHDVRAHQAPGQRDVVWVVDIGERLVIDASWMPGTPADVVAEIEAILDSIATGHWG